MILPDLPSLVTVSRTKINTTQTDIYQFDDDPQLLKQADSFKADLGQVHHVIRTKNSLQEYSMMKQTRNQFPFTYYNCQGNLNKQLHANYLIAYGKFYN